MTDTVLDHNGERVWRISKISKALNVPIRRVYAYAKDHNLEIFSINGHNYVSCADILRAASPYTVYTALQAYGEPTPPSHPSSPPVQPVVPKKNDARIAQLKKAISGLLDAVYTKGEINYHPIINEKLNEWTSELHQLEGN